MESLRQLEKGDELNFVLFHYGDIMDILFGKAELGISFFADSEKFVDEIRPAKKSYLEYGSRKVTIYQDFSLKKEEKTLTDCNICKINDKRFLKIITPFTRERSYDFIIAVKDDMEVILAELKSRAERINFTAFDYPVIGIDLENLKKETIDFLLNEDFRKFCTAKKIQLKRGIILEGKCGTGKTISLKWLKEQALKHDMTFYSFKNPEAFLLSEKSFYNEKIKKIFVFEDFDTFLLERDKEKPHNVVLSNILNTLEGVDEIKNVVTVFTTNQLNYFDQAFLRPGRIDRVITYNLPTKEQCVEFFEAYIPELNSFFHEMVIYLSQQACDISYAVLKGICDDINITIYDSKEDIQISQILKIIDRKLLSASPERRVKTKADLTM